MYKFPARQTNSSKEKQDEIDSPVIRKKNHISVSSNYVQYVICTYKYMQFFTWLFQHYNCN